MAPAHEGRTANFDRYPSQKHQKSQRGCASVMDRPARAGRGASKVHKPQLTVTNLDAVSKANAEIHVTKNSSRACVPAQHKTDLASGFASPQRTLTPQSSCTELESASSQESSFRDVEPEVERQALPSWLQPSLGKAPAGGVRTSWRQRGRQLVTTSGSHQDNLTRTNLRARGNAVLAGVRAGLWCDDAMAAPGPHEHNYHPASVSQYHDWLHLAQAQTTTLRLPELAEQAPMKVDLALLASAGVSFPPGLAPPPGLEMPSAMPL